MKKTDTNQIKPTKVVINPLLNHGPAGWLINRLQRQSLMGWVVAGVIMLLLFFNGAISALVPRPVMVVDQAGNIVGNIEYLKAAARSDQELVAASMRYLTNRLSLNSATIYNDLAEALNMESPEMQAITKAAISADNYLKRVEQVKSRSWLEFYNGSNAPAVLDHKGLDAHVRLRGNINVDVGGKYAEPKPFDVTLTVRSVARNTKNTAGLQITESRDN